MSWDAVAAIAEALGAIGVIATLVYLASQIRQAERTTLASIQHSSIMNGFQLNIALAEAETAALFVKGAREFGALDLTERHRITLLLRASFAWYEDIFSHARRGVVDVDFWHRHRTNIMTLLRAPGLLEWWRHDQGFFSDGFRDEVNQQLAAQQGAAAAEPHPIDR